MQVDNALPHTLSQYNPSFEEFFNMDLFAGPSSTSPSGSSGSSPRSSPSNSFSGLPLTPPEPFSINDISLSPSPFFSLTHDDDQFKSTSVPPAATTAGYDFLAAYAHMHSPESSGSGSGSASSPSGYSAGSIDPQLMHTPATDKAASDFGEEEEGEDDDDLILDNDDLQSIPEDYVLPQMKVGGKGKANRKGTIREGGIVKRQASADKKENKQPSLGMLATTSVDPDDWRPSPEEYKKMSSKEKRQLRNKISARNFRVRRKEYITTLEGDIADRDKLIDAIRTELGTMRSENVALRQEIDGLKRALLDGRGTASLPPPGPLPAVSAVARASASSPPPTPRSPLLTPNTQKDLPTSPRLNARGFWGGASHGMGGFGSITPVHTTLVPEWGSVLSGKGGAPGRKSPTLQENINPNLNPALNGSTAAAIASLLNGRNEEKPKEQQITMGGFDAFSDMNPFTLKSLDAYRMQLWGKMAQQQMAQRQSQASAGTPAPSGLAGNLRPHYFSKSSTLSALLSGKSSSSSTTPSSILHPYPTPPSSPPLGHKAVDTPTPQQAMLATMASQTLFSKLGSAFWDAFAHSSPASGPSSSGKREWDADKVRRVMEGTAVVRVVDVEPQPAPLSRTSSIASTKTEKECSSKHKECVGAVHDLLAESMASLSISRK